MTTPAGTRGSTWASALVAPSVVPALDPLFRPAALAWRRHQQLARESAHPVRARFALEQKGGAVSVFNADLLPDGHPLADANFGMLERLVKLALWAHGGFRIHLDAPAPLAAALRAHYREGPTGRFDSEMIGERVYDQAIEVVATRELPPARSTTAALGGHLEGCRIGFDLGGSDRKVAAIIDGNVVFSEETEWDPYHQTDPQYHWDGIMDSLLRAARHLPRVDAIGGSAAGVYVNNRVRFSPLFRGIGREDFERRVRDLFLDLRRVWRDVPFEVANDGDVAALLGAMSIGRGQGVLGIALGTSTAGGYITGEGSVTPWLNEIAFVPVDYRADAPRDEWSGDHGCFVQYLSQQAVGRLLGPAGIDVPATMPLPARLRELQARMAAGDPRAEDVYRTIGAYLGYAFGHLASVYRFGHVLVLGRVTTGARTEVLLDPAREVLEADFPEARCARRPADAEREGQAARAGHRCCEPAGDRKAALAAGAGARGPGTLAPPAPPGCHRPPSEAGASPPHPWAISPMNLLAKSLSYSTGLFWATTSTCVMSLPTGVIVTFTLRIALLALEHALGPGALGLARGDGDLLGLEGLLGALLRLSEVLLQVALGAKGGVRDACDRSSPGRHAAYGGRQDRHQKTDSPASPTHCPKTSSGARPKPRRQPLRQATDAPQRWQRGPGLRGRMAPGCPESGLSSGGSTRITSGSRPPARPSSKSARLWEVLVRAGPVIPAVIDLERSGCPSRRRRCW
ncbi:MAG: ROK family protein [Myxococcales bacterium]